MEKLLTVVIPSYNIQKYIDHTIRSFISAEEILPRLEILIVNDGSKDDTLTMAKGYEAKYPDTIRVIDKENGGHGSAINRGIPEASGKYYKVVDGDDWVESENLVKVIRYLEGCDADLVLSPFYIYHEGDGSREVSAFMRPFSGTKRFDDICKDMNKISIHGILIKTSILRDNQIRMDEKVFYEDAEYVCYPIPYADTAEYLDCPLTVYRVGTNEQSMNTKNLWLRREQHLKVVKSLIDFYQRLDTTPRKKEYLRRCVATMAEGQYRIYYVGPIEASTRQELVAFDQELKNTSLEIYDAVEFKLLRILRKLGFPLYRLAASTYQKR